jgi:hypothetical protein
MEYLPKKKNKERKKIDGIPYIWSISSHKILSVPFLLFVLVFTRHPVDGEQVT